MEQYDPNPGGGGSLSLDVNGDGARNYEDIMDWLAMPQTVTRVFDVTQKDNPYCKAYPQETTEVPLDEYNADPAYNRSCTKLPGTDVTRNGSIDESDIAVLENSIPLWVNVYGE